VKTLLYIILFFHSVFHLFGFLKAFNLAKLDQLTVSVSRRNGVMWLATTVLFFTGLVLMILNLDSWVIVSVFAIVLSQYLIFTTWHDSKSGTLINVLFLAIVIAGWGKISFHYRYMNEVESAMKASGGLDQINLQEVDLLNLPEPVRKYIVYVGCLGKPKVHNFRINFDGKIRKSNESEWMPFSSEQYNFIDNSTRLFFMNATMMKLPVVGFHSFKNGDAFMDIRLLSLFKVQYQSGKEMGIAETVTYFNDMCCMAPATLIDKRIEWDYSAGDSVYAKFTNNGISINAILVFNGLGELTNFISDDRFAASDSGNMQKIRWSTPLKNYKIVDEFKLATDAQTIYSYPEGDLIYGTFHLKAIKYNINSVHF
jgi:hypothetical protein